MAISPSDFPKSLTSSFNLPGATSELNTVATRPQGRTGKFGGPVRNNGLGPGDLVKDHEYQAIPVGKRDMLCESTNVRSHTSAMCCVKTQMLEVTRVTDS